MKRMSVQTSILIPALSVLIAGVIILVVAVGAISTSSTNDLTNRLMSARVNEYANEFEALCMESYGMVTSLAPLMLTFTDFPSPRDEAIKGLTGVLMSNSTIMGVWTCWEPNAFDGLDSEHAGIEYYDSTGRFAPYVYKTATGYGVETLEGYDIPGEGDYYLGARNSGKPYVTDPYEYVVDGKTTPLYSIAAPIIRDGVVVGVVGVDINLEDVVATMNAGSILDVGYFTTLSPGGLIATHRNADMLMEDYKVAWMKNYSTYIDAVLKNGDSFSITAYSDVIGANVRMLTNAVMIGDTGRYWAICGIVPDSKVTEASTNLLLMVIAIGIGLILCAGITILLIVRGRLRQLPVMTAMAETIAKGDVNLAGLDKDTGRTKNEIALLGRAFASIADSIRDQSDTMTQIADGDYSVTAPIRCEADVMNMAINNMLERVNETLREIRSSTEQVSTGSKQIADGAQSLAQGSTEQAAAVEQLSSSISEIANKTKVNADMAGKAAQLAGTIKGNAEKGSQQMDEMMAAVKDINLASQNINKVIKVIDDIAFQTNILALNAAVEAARAGQHGKGFAVVAEEVRNLAAKSAEAAKDTGELISNSMEKAELGARIANETAASLAEIVSGINESGQLVGEIARSSEEQSAGISQINKGIDQVAQVVQQNSATAEQSAAASEQMSGQANMLEELISQFKLSGGDAGRRLQSPSSSPKAPRKTLSMPEKTSYAPNHDSGDYGKY